MKKVILRTLILAVVVAAAWGGYRLFQQMPQRQQEIPITKVRRGDVVVRSFTRGELRAVRSATLIAPNLFGTVQVTRMAALGAFAREKDLVVEFDDAEVQSRLEEKQLEIEQVDERIKKAKADLEIRNNQDQVELLRTRYSVRRAELEVKRNELISAIDAKKNLLTLEEARRRLKQLESDIKSRQAQAEAELAVLQEQRNKAMLEMQRERQRLSQVKLLSPMSGLVSIRQNTGGSFRMMGMQMPDIREGDQIQPGMQVADVLDLSELEVNAKVGELDRANLHEGQDVIITLDAVPEKTFTGKIKALSGTASANIFSGDPGKKFDVTFSIDMKQLLSALGATPEQVRRVMETAEQNRKKPQQPSSMMAGLGGFGGGTPGGGGGGMMMRAAGGGGEQGGGAGGPGGGFSGGAQALGMRGPGSEGGAQAGGRAGGAAGGGRQAMSDEMRKLLEKELKGRSIQDLTQAERQAIFTKLRAAGGGQAAGAGAGQAGARAAGAGAGQAGARTEGAARGEGRRAAGGDGAAGGGEGRRAGRQGGEGGGQIPGGRPFGGGPVLSEADLAKAKLPPPPEEDDQLEVLLRPGLLADVEIIVEKIPNAIHIPNQAIFEKDGKLIAYVRNGKNWDTRVVKPLKRSETTMVIADGLKEGEIVALADPTAKRDDKKGAAKEKASGSGAPPMGGGRKN